MRREANWWRVVTVLSDSGASGLASGEWQTGGLGQEPLCQPQQPASTIIILPPL